jgi:mRNA-degrading endonuclease toxin of MazEF toxin-antitoxin module
LIPAAGELWLADRGEATRRLVFVISAARFHRLAERAVVAPVVEALPASPRPWHIPVGDRAVAVNQLGTMPTDRLLERVDQAGLDTLRLVRRAVQEIAN